MSFDTMGKQFGDLPTGTPIHIKMADNPMTPGVLRRHFVKDPANTTYNVEPPNAMNVAVSGVSLALDIHGARWHDGSGQDKAYDQPMVLMEEGVPASGLNGCALPYSIYT